MPSVAQVEFIVSGILREYTSLWGFGLGGLVSEAGAERLAGYIGNHKDFTISNGCHRGVSEHAVYIYGARLWDGVPQFCAIDIKRAVWTLPKRRATAFNFLSEHGKIEEWK